MCDKSLILSSRGLRNIVLNNQEKEEEFIFIFGEKEFKMQRMFAEFISPRVSHMHQCDPTISSLAISQLVSQNSNRYNQIINNLLTENTIKAIEAISCGYSTELEDECVSKLRIISAIFDNEELFNEINKKQKDKKQIDDIIEELQIYQQISPSFIEKYVNQNIEILCDHLSKEKVDIKLTNLPKTIFYSIVTNENFKVADNDKLFEIVNTIISNDESEEKIKNIELYETVDMTKLSENKLKEMVLNLDYTEMTGTMWRKICEVILNGLKEKERKNHEINFEFDGNASHRFSGIVDYIVKNKKKNESNEDVIDVKANSTNGAHYPKFAIYFDSSKYFFSSENFTTWLQYDFKDKKIRPTSYSIKTRNDSDNDNPLNWCIEVSNTGKENDWKTIDSRKDVKTVSKRDQSDTFLIGTKLLSNESYRFIRLRCTGCTSNNCGYLAISSLEYFGTLFK